MNISGMTHAEETRQQRRMSGLASLQERADAEGWTSETMGRSAEVAAQSVTIGGVSVYVGPGLPSFTGPGRFVRELRDRVRAAIITSGLAWPMRRISVSSTLPAGDLPVALAILAASGQVTTAHAQAAYAAAVPGLGLDGSLRPCRFRDLAELLAATRPAASEPRE
jgi:magnesium chelatase family protein